MEKKTDWTFKSRKNFAESQASDVRKVHKALDKLEKAGKPYTMEDIQKESGVKDQNAINLAVKSYGKNGSLVNYQCDGKGSGKNDNKNSAFARLRKGTEDKPEFSEYSVAQVQEVIDLLVSVDAAEDLTNIPEEFEISEDEFNSLKSMLSSLKQVLTPAEEPSQEPEPEFEPEVPGFEPEMETEVETMPFRKRFARSEKPDSFINLLTKKF